MKIYQKPDLLFCRFLPEDIITVSSGAGSVQSIEAQMNEADVFAVDYAKWTEWGES